MTNWGASKEGLSFGKDELLKGKLALEHSLGLGHKPNVIPAATPDTRGPARPVEIGWHPVAGFAGKWFAEKTRLGTWITEKVHKYPDPSQHWAVLVGDYCHELWMDEHLDVIYINERVQRDEWHTYPVGETRFNDEALRQAGERTIAQMRDVRPAYNLISNNCQNFALLLLDAIQTDDSSQNNTNNNNHHQFGTALAVVQTATGPGRIKDLFEDEATGEQVAVVEPVVTKDNPIVALAKRLMDEHTTKLDNHHHIH
jgi:hypothetical protein